MAAVRDISLRWIVPALSAVILAIVVSIFGAIAYRYVRASALDTAAERLETVVQVLSQPTQQQATWIRELTAVANAPDVVDLVQSGGTRVSEAARRRIAVLTPDTGQTLATDVRSVNGAVLFSVTSPRARDAGSDTSGRVVAIQGRDSTDLGAHGLTGPARLTRSYPDTATSSELFLSGKSVVLERAVPIRANGRLVGHVVQVRRVAPSPTARRQLFSLIGTEAVLVVGNRDGSLWSDLEKAVEHPRPSDSATTYERDGRRWLSASGPLATGPWVIAVEFPEDIILAPVRALRWRLFVMGTVIVFLAILVTERLSRRLTVPLRSLTTAAEALAAGQHLPPVSLSRSDEIGRLSRAFDAMAQSIRTSHDTLEHQIGDRTRELQMAVTRLQETQHELVRQERLAALGHVSGSIAHELRNPLGVMTNALYYLESVLQDAPPKVHEHLAKLRAQVRLSGSIITGLLDFTRSGHPQLGNVDVAQLVEEQLGRLTIPPSVRVVRDISPNVPEMRVDPVQAGQILTNLLINAVQAMDGIEGVLTVRARSSGERVRIEVEDTGPGVGPEAREHIFEPLFTTKARGIGLGLSVSRSLARANGGDLTVASAADRGAVFALEVPAASPSHARPDGLTHQSQTTANA